MEEQMNLFEDGGLNDEGGKTDEVSGNDVPSGSTRKEVRDDIPAMLSEGEFVLPADVVRYHGLEKIMQLRDEAKFGLRKMEAMGQMGNSEEATLEDDVPFGPADLVILAGEPVEDNDKPREMAEGGVVKAQAGTFVPASGIMGYQPSIYQGQQTSATYTPPPSSVAPPAPTPSPAGGYLPKFVTNQTTPFDDGSLPPPPSSGAPTGTDTSGVSTASTEDKFVEEVQDKYTSIKYINPETGEMRDFYFYNGNPVTPIPEGFVPYDETTDEVVDDLESTAVETTLTQQTEGGEGGPQFDPNNPFGPQAQNATGDPSTVEGMMDNIAANIAEFGKSAVAAAINSAAGPVGLAVQAITGTTISDIIGLTGGDDDGDRSGGFGLAPGGLFGDVDNDGTPNIADFNDGYGPFDKSKDKDTGSTSTTKSSGAPSFTPTVDTTDDARAARTGDTSGSVSTRGGGSQTGGTGATASGRQGDGTRGGGGDNSDGGGAQTGGTGATASGSQGDGSRGGGTGTSGGQAGASTGGQGDQGKGSGWGGMNKGGLANKKQMATKPKPNKDRGIAARKKKK